MALVEIEPEGYGSEVPPCLKHVKIYFLEKGQSEVKATDFYAEYNAKGWRNRKGRLIRNWKCHAWEWIWKM